MSNHLNISYQQSFKGTQATGNGFSIINKSQNHNITDLYKQDSVSSDQPVPLNNKVEDFFTLQQEQLQHKQIKKFMKKAQKLNQLSYRKLHEGKALVPQSSTINIYKSNKNILDQISIPVKRDRQIRSIYLKNVDQKRKTHFNAQKTFRSTNSNKSKLTTDSKWVQTDILNGQSSELQKNKKINSVENNKVLSTKKLRKTLKAIEQDEDEQFIPVKRKNPTKKLFNTISLVGNQRNSVDANAYLHNISRAEHDFNKSVRRYSIKQQFKPSSTFYNDSERTASSFLQPIVNQSNHWENMTVQQKNKNNSQLPVIKQKTSIFQETKKQTQSNKQAQIKLATNKITQEMTQNSLFVENDNSVKKSKISETQFTMFKANYSNNFDEKQMTGFKFPQNIQSLQKNQEKKVKSVEKGEIYVQIPQVHEIAIGTDTDTFVKSPKKTIHPISYAFSDSDTNWITSNYKPKSSFLKNVDTKKFNIKKYRNGVYFGQISEQGLKNGNGAIFYFNGRSYQGNFVNDMKEGKGFQYMPDGSVFSGEFKKGLKEGKGIFQWPNGQVYDGQWIAGKKNGSGMWKSPKGDSYLGQWKNGKIEGFGVLTIKQGDRYEGQFKNSMKNGLGTERYSNGDTYVGNFSKNRPNGQGEYYYRNGDTYKGMFSNGLKHGNGVFKTKNGQTYQGEFRNEKKCGYGEQTNEEGVSYKGNFENNLKHGYGQQTSTEGFSVKGYWINGKLIETEMGPIIQDELDRQQSIPTDMKIKRKNKKSIIQQHSHNNNHITQRKQRKVRKEGKQRKKSPKRSPQNSIAHSLSPNDPNFHRSCGCKRAH